MGSKQIHNFIWGATPSYDEAQKDSFNIMEKKQTALQWFKDVTYPYLDKESKEYVDILFNHALQMEREQIDNFIDFINERHFNQFIISKDEAEIYYEQTYGCQDE
jgi:hypothetical protein